jgi:hypothetical protein
MSRHCPLGSRVLVPSPQAHSVLIDRSARPPARSPSVEASGPCLVAVRVLRRLRRQARALHRGPDLPGPRLWITTGSTPLQLGPRPVVALLCPSPPARSAGAVLPKLPEGCSAAPTMDAARTAPRAAPGSAVLPPPTPGVPAAAGRGVPPNGSPPNRRSPNGPVSERPIRRFVPELPPNGLPSPNGLLLRTPSLRTGSPLRTPPSERLPPNASLRTPPSDGRSKLQAPPLPASSFAAISPSP